MPALVTRAQLAALAGVSRAAVTQACRARGQLAPAVIGDHVDQAHPVVAAWLKGRGVDTTTGLQVAKSQRPRPTSPTPRKAPQRTTKGGTITRVRVEPVEAPTGHEDDGTAEGIADVADLTLREIGAKFGGQAAFNNWLKSLNLVETIRARRLDNEEAESTLIRRDFVEAQVFGHLEEQAQKLLTELPKTLARTVQAQAKAGLSLSTSEKEIRSAITKTLEATRAKISRKLKKQ